MRLGWLVGALSVAVCLVPVLAEAAGPTDGPGCVGIAYQECLAWLRSTMRLDESFLGNATAGRQLVDVNGKRIGGLVTVYAKLPDRMEAFVILLHVGSDDRVQRVESNLLHNIIDARTEAAYDRSAFYDIASRLLGRRCAGTPKIELYRFFENMVKPRIKQERQDLANGLFGFHRVVSHVAGLPLCGATFGYTNYVEWRGSADPEAGRSPNSFSSIELR